MKRETISAFYRPANRRLMSLTNEELRSLFEMRAKKVEQHIDPNGFWDCNQIIYWNDMFEPLAALFEVMLEIQSRYPYEEVMGRDPTNGRGGPFFTRMLPLANMLWIEVASNEWKIRQSLYGLKETLGFNPQTG